MGRGRPHPHAAVAEGRRARADRQTDRRRCCGCTRSLLPYAVVFGQEKQWAKELAVLYGQEQLAGLVRGLERVQRGVVLVGHRHALGEHGVVVVASGGSSGGGSAGGGGGGGGGGGRGRSPGTGRRPRATSQGRSERLPTGPCPLHQECPAITCGRCHSKTTSVLELYNDEVTEGKSFPLSFCDSFRAWQIRLSIAEWRDDVVTTCTRDHNQQLQAFTRPKGDGEDPADGMSVHLRLSTRRAVQEYRPRQGGEA